MPGRRKLTAAVKLSVIIMMACVHLKARIIPILLLDMAKVGDIASTAAPPPLPQNVQEEYTSENLPAAFWDRYPTNTEENTDLAAINAIIEESTPDERAETYKVSSSFWSSLSPSSAGFWGEESSSLTRFSCSNCAGPGKRRTEEGSAAKEEVLLARSPQPVHKGPGDGQHAP